jgi:uncharacterized protein
MQQNQEQPGGGAMPEAPKKNRNSLFYLIKHAPDHVISIDDNQIMRLIKITGVILLCLLSLFVMVKTINEVKAYPTIGESNYSQYMITVTGKGEVPVSRDIATISFTSNGKGKTASEAQSVAATANNKAIEFLKTKGVSEKDIKTESYNTFPTYDQKVRPCIVESARGVETMVAPAIAPIAPCNTYESVITGYETSQTVRITIRDIQKNPDLSGEIITGLGDAGVQAGNLQLSVDKPEQYKANARAIAIADARMQAKQIAKSLGVRLGDVVSFYENESSEYPMYDRPMMAEMGMKSVSPEIPAGETDVTSNVSVTFEIKQ